MKIRTVSNWQKIFDALVHLADAPENDRDGFIERAAAGQLTEYRFCGNLGHEGKIHLRRDGRLYVSCNPNHTTAKRRLVVNRLNALLEFL